MIKHKQIENVSDYIASKIEDINTSIFQKIGETIKIMSTLNPSQAYQLSQILKYGGTYEEIEQELARISGKNIQEIYKIFDLVAKDNKQFAKEFYKYRGIEFTPYLQDKALQNQVRSIATLTANVYKNIANTSGIGFLFTDLNGQMYFKNIQQGYYEIVDRGIIAISQGKATFQQEMTRIINDLGKNGVVLYESGRTRRLDSALRMNILDGVRQLNQVTNQRFGMEYGADGVEIGVHSNPAPDHEDIQGRQFSNEEYDKLMAGDIATDVKGRTYEAMERRHIGEYNCYHDMFQIIVGVSDPIYTDEELQKIIDDNNKGFVFEGRKYTNYEGTQLQRRIELAIRKQKDKQVLARSSGEEFKEIAQESQRKINMLTDKYNQLCKISGLLPKKQRMSVSGYRKIKERV